MPPQLRTAEQEGATAQEVLLVAELPTGLYKIDLTDCHREFGVPFPFAAYCFA